MSLLALGFHTDGVIPVNVYMFHILDRRLAGPLKYQADQDDCQALRLADVLTNGSMSVNRVEE